jgi:hypothetical protein
VSPELFCSKKKRGSSDLRRSCRSSHCRITKQPNNFTPDLRHSAQTTADIAEYPQNASEDYAADAGGPLSLPSLNRASHQSPMPNSTAPTYTLGSYVGTIPRRIRHRTWNNPTSPTVLERLARIFTILVFFGCGGFWVAYNIFRLRAALPVLQSRRVAVATVPVPGLVVCGGAFDRVGCQTGPFAEANPLDKRDCGARMTQLPGLTVQSFPELRSVFDPRWKCFVLDPRPTAPGADAGDGLLGDRDVVAPSNRRKGRRHRHGEHMCVTGLIQRLD